MSAPDDPADCLAGFSPASTTAISQGNARLAGKRGGGVDLRNITADQLLEIEREIAALDAALAPLMAALIREMDLFMADFEQRLLATKTKQGYEND